MLWASFGEEGYAMGVATSASGLVKGPWVQQESPLWARNGGHGMIFTDGQGDSRLVFHWPNDTPNERVKLVPVSITADGIELQVDISHEERLRGPGWTHRSDETCVEVLADLDTGASR